MKKMIRGVCGFLALTCGLLMGAIITLSHQLPEQFSVVEGTPLNLNGAVEAGAPRSASGQTVETASLAAGSSYTAPLRLFGMFPVKNVAVKVVDLPVVVPCGTPFGIKMFTDGVLVVGMSDVDTASGSHNPARSAGIKTGDVIVSIDKKIVNTTEQVAKMVEESGGKTMVFHIRRDNIAFDVKFVPAKSVNENRWKAGLWVRDSSAGIGTLTFYNPQTKTFGGLGHAVCDVDTGEVLPEGTQGELVFTSITKQAFPLLRYRTRDICILRHEDCPCGRTHIKMCKPMGRSDDMLIVKGVNVFPSQIETVLLEQGYTSNYQIVVDRVNNSDTLDVLVEMTPEHFSDSLAEITQREKSLVAALKAMLGIFAQVHLVSPKSIARSEGKAIRVIDKRRI